MTKAMQYVLNQVARTDVHLFLPKGGSVALLLDCVLCMSQSCLCTSIQLWGQPGIFSRVLNDEDLRSGRA